MASLLTPVSPAAVPLGAAARRSPSSARLSAATARNSLSALPSRPSSFLPGAAIPSKSHPKNFSPPHRSRRQRAGAARAQAFGEPPKDEYDVVVIGSGIGGLTAAALLAYHGDRVLVCESHYRPGGAAHGFEKGGYRFESGPSFFAGLTKVEGLNPLAAALALVGEPLDVVEYDPLGTYHIPGTTAPLRRYGNLSKFLGEVRRENPEAASELEAATPQLRGLHASLRNIPVPALRADLGALLILGKRYLKGLGELAPWVSVINGPTSGLMDKFGMNNAWLRRLVDLECFLLSGLKADGTIAAEFASVFGESDVTPTEFPVGGSEAIVDALIRGLEKHGGEIVTKTHVDEIVVEGGSATGVRIKGGRVIRASKAVVSNATLWDTYNKLLPKGALPGGFYKKEMATPATPSFMHLHLGIDAAGLDLSELGGHHVVVLREDDLSAEHAYTMEEWGRWEEYGPEGGRKKDAEYAAMKMERAGTLYRALEKVIPDIRARVEVEMIGTPITHSQFLRRHKGTYGPGIIAGQGSFPGPGTPIKGLWRVGDSCAPGIGVPAAAGSGMLCANTLISTGQQEKMLDTLEEIKARP